MSGWRTKAHDYDLARGLRFYEGAGNLPERAAALWQQISHAEKDLAREFWRRYRRSEELQATIGDDQVESLADRIVPYIRAKFSRLNDPSWVATARGYVEKALGADLSLSTLLAGLNAETEAAYAAIRAS